LSRLAAVRRLALIAALGAVLAGCGGSETVSPTGEVEGTLPKAEPANPAAGKSLFTEAGCSGCHTFAAANATGKTGPDLDENLKDKNEEYIRESIVEPDAEVAEGFQPGIMPPYEGSSKEVADLVAFLSTQRQS
jgi:mono/diheme cytochrome c family protein